MKLLYIIHPKGGYGGIGGIHCKPTALSNVNKFYHRLGDRLDIIGCGGITTGRDVFEHILCGASAVQVGTCFLEEGLSCFDRLQTELIEIMQQKNYTCLNDFKGCLKIQEAK